MALLQFSGILRNFRNNAMEPVFGASPKLQFWDGTMPPGVGNSPSGTLLCEMQLPVDWMGGSSLGGMQKLGTWEGVGISGGTARYFRLLGGTGFGGCHMQGDIGETGSGAAMEMNSTTIILDEPVVVQAFTLVDGNPG